MKNFLKVIFSFACIFILLLNPQSGSLIFAKSAGDVQDFRVNDDQGNTTQEKPSIATDSNGNFVICWRDLRGGLSHTYAQRFNSDGLPQGANFQVDNDFGSTGRPDIGMAGNGNFVITWLESHGELGIFFQRYASDGSRLGSHVMLPGPSMWFEEPAISVANDGSFVIIWKSSARIFCSRYDSNGKPIDEYLHVNESEVGCKSRLGVDMDQSGNFVVAWTDDRNRNPDIYCQRFKNDGTKLGSNILVSIDINRMNQDNPAIVVDKYGNFVICWTDERNTDERDIYAQRFDKNGVALGQNFRVNENAIRALPQSSAISIDNSGNFVICWVDRRNPGSDIYAQRFSSNGQPLGENFQVNHDNGNSGHGSPDVCISKGKMYFTWHDNRDREQGYDIYANIQEWQEPITLISPNGGEYWEVGTTYPILWDGSGITGEVRIEFSKEKYSNYSLLTWATENDGQWDWTPEEKHISPECWIKISSVDNLSLNDRNNAPFGITAELSEKIYHAKKIPDQSFLPIIDGVLNDPVWTYAADDSVLQGGIVEGWGTAWTDWDDNLVTWRAVWSAITNKLYVAIKIKDNERGDFDDSEPGSLQPWNEDCLELFVDGDNGGGFYDDSYMNAQQWMVTGENKIVLDDYPTSSAFELYTGDDLKTATTWGTNGDWILEAEFSIYDLMPASPRTLSEGDIIGWNIWYDDSDNQAKESGKFKRDHQVGWLYEGKANNDADFLGDIILDGAFILPDITVVTPGGGETWQVGTTQTIVWNSSMTSGYVNIELSRDNGISWEPLFSNIPDDGLESWTVTAPVSANCLMRVSDVDGSPLDVSNAPFSIIAGAAWTVPMTIYGGSGAFIRTFGGSGAATDGFDAGLDVPAAPPAMTYYTYFAIDEFPNSLDTDIRQWIAPYEGAIEWKLKIINATGITTTLAWDNADLPLQGSFSITGVGIAIDMRNQNSVTVTGSMDLIIRYGIDIPVTFNFPERGWYLISLPVTPTDNALHTLFPTALIAFGYNPLTNAYYEATTIEPKKGYWLLISTPSTATISGLPLVTFTEQYHVGWHLIGAVKGTVDFTSPNDNPAGSVLAAYGHDPATSQYYTVYPGGSGKLVEKNGYWLAVLNPCNLTIGGGMTKSVSTASLKDLSAFFKKYGPQPPVPPFVRGNEIDDVLPLTEIISRNYPNPFNPETVIEYTIPQAGLTRIEIYNALGQKIRTLVDKALLPGNYRIVWDGRNDRDEWMANGVYFYKIVNGNMICTGKMLMLK